MRLRSISSLNSGFTLLEVLIAVAILLMVFALGAWMSMDMFKSVSFGSEEQVIASLLTRARSNAMNNIDGATWGVCLYHGSYVLFSGTECMGEGSESFPAGSDVAIAGFDAPIVFSQLAGTTTPASLTVTQHTHVSLISINYEGTIAW